jgi:hypothetical protein
MIDTMFGISTPTVGSLSSRRDCPGALLKMWEVVTLVVQIRIAKLPVKKLKRSIAFSKRSLCTVKQPRKTQNLKSRVLRSIANMADRENEHEHEIEVQETPIEKVEIDPSTLTPTSPEVISRYIRRKETVISYVDKRR